MDRLENFIVENKEKFNDHIPSPDVWTNIEKEINQGKSKKFSIRKFASVGVAAIGLVMLGVWFGSSYQADDMDQVIANSSFKDYKQTEHYYAVQVKNYLKEINELDNTSTIENDINQLDEVYNELREELLNAEVKNQDKIINAMIKNYQVKVGMLERILEKTKEKDLIKELKNSNHEKVSI